MLFDGDESSSYSPDSVTRPDMFPSPCPAPLPPLGTRAFHNPPLPWHSSMEPKPCPAWLEYLNRVYSSKSVPPNEVDRFKQMYARDTHHCHLAVALYEGRSEPSKERGFAPLPDPTKSSEPSNTTVFVGGLVGRVSPDLLQALFLPFGPIEYAKCPEHKNCGFVKFIHKKDAEWAIARMQGFPLDKSVLRTSWASTGSGVDRPAPGGVLSPDTIKRFSGYIDAQGAQLVLQALETLFAGNVHQLKEGLEFLSASAPAQVPASALPATPHRERSSVPSHIPVGRGGISPHIGPDLRAYLEQYCQSQTRSRVPISAGAMRRSAKGTGNIQGNAALNVNAPAFQANKAHAPVSNASSPSADFVSIEYEEYTSEFPSAPFSDIAVMGENDEPDLPPYRPASRQIDAPIALGYALDAHRSPAAIPQYGMPANDPRLSASAPRDSVDMTRQRESSVEHTAPRRPSDPVSERRNAVNRPQSQQYAALGLSDRPAAWTAAPDSAYVRWNRYPAFGPIGSGANDGLAKFGSGNFAPFAPGPIHVRQQ